jgi:hypothetical protein
MPGFGLRAEPCPDQQPPRTEFGATLPIWYTQGYSHLFHLIPTARSARLPLKGGEHLSG